MTVDFEIRDFKCTPYNCHWRLVQSGICSSDVCADNPCGPYGKCRENSTGNFVCDCDSGYSMVKGKSMEIFYYFKKFLIYR